MRLTHYDEHKKRWQINDDYGAVMIDELNYAVGEAVDKLAVYEDAEEQGLLVRLPCKVGDTAYVIWASSIYPENPPAVREDHITQVKFTKKGYAFKTWRGWYHKSDIGKTVFLSSEEAEDALAPVQYTGHPL